MRLALMVTNTDDSAFAARHPRDAEKFAALIAGVRPGWQVQAFDLPQEGCPADLAGFDGVLIGGSPASVNEDHDWVAPLMELIRQGATAGVPMLGLCFGHQAIARALGGTVGLNPGGWVLGTAETTIVRPAPWMAGDAAPMVLAAAHTEQVTALPPGAEVVGQSAGCEVAMYRVGDRIFACQHHPEMTPDFIAALVEELAPDLPDGVAQAARASLVRGLQGARFAGWAARFFEQAVG
jgi:GMP synthase-like glutamine amidotransferase